MGQGTYQTLKRVQYIIGIRTETSQRINAVHNTRGTYLPVYSIYIYLWSSVCLCRREGMSKKAIPVNIFVSIFSALFCLLIKKLLLEIKTIWQNMRKFPCRVWSARTFPHMDKEYFFFLKTAHWYGLIFLDKYLLIRLENLKTSL